MEDTEGKAYSPLPGISSTDFAGRVGAGVDIGITDQIAVVLEGSYVGASDFDYSSISWGLQYRF